MLIVIPIALVAIWILRVLVSGLLDRVIANVKPVGIAY